MILILKQGSPWANPHKIAAQMKPMTATQLINSRSVGLRVLLFLVSQFSRHDFQRNILVFIEARNLLEAIFTLSSEFINQSVCLIEELHHAESCIDLSFQNHLWSYRMSIHIWSYPGNRSTELPLRKSSTIITSILALQFLIATKVDCVKEMNQITFYSFGDRCNLKFRRQTETAQKSEKFLGSFTFHDFEICKCSILACKV